MLSPVLRSTKGLYKPCCRFKALYNNENGRCVSEFRLQAGAEEIAALGEHHARSTSAFCLYTVVKVERKERRKSS